MKTLAIAASCAFLAPTALGFTSSRRRFGLRQTALQRAAPVASAEGSSEASPKKSLLRLFSGEPDPVLCCPISLEPLVKSSRFFGQLDEVWTDQKFGTEYRPNGVYLDLVPSAPGKPIWERSLQEIVQTDTFRNPIVAFLYERGWRQVTPLPRFPPYYSSSRQRQTLLPPTVALQEFRGTGKQVGRKGGRRA